MNIRNFVALVLVVSGSILLGGALWSLASIYTCPEGTPDCEGWAIWGGYVLGPTSFGLLVGGIALYKRYSAWFQLVAALGLAWGVYWGFV